MPTNIPSFDSEMDIARNCTLILHNNINDCYIFPYGENKGISMSLADYIFFKLSMENPDSVIINYDPVDGFFNHAAPKHEEEFARLAGLNENSMYAPFSSGDNNTPSAAAIIRGAMKQNKKNCFVIIHGSHLVPSSDHLTSDEQRAFSMLVKATEEGAIVTGNKNKIILLTRDLKMLPSWFLTDVADKRVIDVRYPSLSERRNFLQESFRSFFDPQVYDRCISSLDEDEIRKAVETFTAKTDGLNYRQIESVRAVVRANKFQIQEINKAIDLFRYGPADNPWTEKDLLDRIEKGKEETKRTIKGQDSAAVDPVFGKLMTVASGFSQLHLPIGKIDRSPKGVFLLCGPTGVGKTELAKQLAKALFFDENNLVRLDMSEYKESSSLAKFTGAAPGYIGSDKTGSFFDLVKSKPFSVILIDEIEKAHQTVLDIFLQILDEGRLTNSFGETVYMENNIFIFTSNLGITAPDPMNPRKKKIISHYGIPRDQLVSNVLSDIEHTFSPELRARFGDNILVFDYISRQTAAEIIEHQLHDGVAKRLLEMGCVATFTTEFKKKLLIACEDRLEQGGRVINSLITSHVEHPLQTIYKTTDALPPKLEFIDIDLSDETPKLNVIESR